MALLMKILQELENSLSSIVRADYFVKECQ
jgi:hypothetical protein